MTPPLGLPAHAAYVMHLKAMPVDVASRLRAFLLYMPDMTQERADLVTIACNMHTCDWPTEKEMMTKRESLY